MSDAHGSTSVNRRRRSPSPSLSPPEPISRKRGWVPATPEPSRPATIPTSSSGYLDTPAKYRGMMDSLNKDDQIDEMAADLPPPKRRRGLAGSIVSTALSAAIIGTAVGLTVYRLWRNRGKQHDSLSPPPYEQGAWVSQSSQSQTESQEQTSAQTSNPVTYVTPPTPRRKQRPVAGRRTVIRYRKTQSHARYATPPRSPSPVKHAFIPSETSFAAPEEVEDDEGTVDHMDWMGDRLAKLIEEGKRALGTEVVIMSDAQEDEVDDGLGAWVEDDMPASSSGSLRKGKGRPRKLHLSSSSSYHGSPQTSPRKNRFDLSHSRNGSSAISIPGRDVSVDSDVHSLVNSSYREDEATWQTQEMRESMERARMLYMQNRRHDRL